MPQPLRVLPSHQTGRKYRLHPGWTLWLALLLGGAGTPAIAAQDVLTFGVQPFASPPALFQRYGPLRDWLGETLGQPVRLESARDIPTFMRRSRNGRYDLVLSAPHLVPLLTDPGPYRPVVRTREDLAMVLVIAPGRGIEGLSDLSGRSIAAPYKESRAATLARQHLAEHPWPEDAPAPQFLHYHHNSAAVAAFQHGLTDALVMIIEGDVLPNPGEPSDPIRRHLSLADGTLVRILAQSEPFPGLTLLIHNRLGPHTESLQDRLLTLGQTPHGARLLRRIGHRGFTPSSAHDYASFQGALESLERELEMTSPLSTEARDDDASNKDQPSPRNNH